MGSDPDEPVGPVEREPVEEETPEQSTALPKKIESWRQRSATGAILTGIARGLHQVFEKEPEQPSIVMETSGEPPTDLPVDAEVESGRPKKSVVSIRPWLLHKKSDDRAESSGSSENGEG